MKVAALTLAATAAFGVATALEHNAAARKTHLAEVRHESSEAICDSVVQYTGYFRLTTGGLLSKNYFYWCSRIRRAVRAVRHPFAFWTQQCVAHTTTSLPNSKTLQKTKHTMMIHSFVQRHFCFAFPVMLTVQVLRVA
jgi:hypothetical protein